MRTKNLHFIIFLALIGFGHLKASHLVGGEINYRCLGNNNYEITLTIYRDCLNGQAPYDPLAAVTTFDAFNTIVVNRQVPLHSVTTLPITAPNNCTTLPTNVCTEKGIYIDTVNLPPIAGGYTISHQRCCRNHTISNIGNTQGIWGSTYTTSIPSMDNCNASPRFNDDPPVVLCLNQHITLDLGATDPEGDSLFYELCEVLHGGSAAVGGGNAAPNPSAPPPFTLVPFLPGFSVTAPITSNPAFTINSSSGILKGKPTQVGQFVFAICVSEYSNGVKLSTTRRDFQFNVSSACKIISSEIQSQFLTSANICSGGPIRFTNLSTNASSFWWDFGDTNSFNDTSRLKNPNFMYQDTGRYWVTLVAEPYTDCADTTIALFLVYDSTRVEFTYKGDHCVETNSLNFKPNGIYGPSATFTWDFGGNTNLGQQSNLKAPSNVKWDSPGSYIVSVEVNDYGCTNTYTEVIEIFPNPVIDEEVEPGVHCVPYTVTFRDKSQASGPVQHYWFFGDGEVSHEPSPTHVYKKPGTFTVEHIIKTLQGCRDSGYSRYEDVIEVLPVPTARLDISPPEQSIYNPIFLLTNSSGGHNFSETILPGGTVVNNLTSQSITLEDTGYHPITHITYNHFGCSDTLVDTLHVTTPFNVFIPNAFTPNGDGVNDVFTFNLTDVRSIHFEVYNRWGEIVFKTKDPNGGWNGRLHNRGEILPPGIYAYVLVAKVKEGAYDHVEQGSINLVR